MTKLAASPAFAAVQQKVLSTSRIRVVADSKLEAMNARRLDTARHEHMTTGKNLLSWGAAALLVVISTLLLDEEACCIAGFLRLQHILSWISEIPFASSGKNASTTIR
mmetsp:Transcript_46809/g.93194  ORF Transcript_46809/g.93194 Transcript_46809/m.93194 type:complete len:108 (+) Transcript_46809:237-560(+)